MRKSRLILALIAVPAFQGAAHASNDAIAAGKAIVEENCAACHAVGPSGNSPLPQAPQFRMLSQHYPVTQLEEAFAEGIITGHPGMPEFDAEPAEIDAIIAYLTSIQAK